MRVLRHASPYLGLVVLACAGCQQGNGTSNPQVGDHTQVDNESAGKKLDEMPKEGGRASQKGESFNASVGMLRGKDAKIREKAVKELIAGGSMAVPALVDALKDKDQSVRSQVVSILGQIGPDAKSAVPGLIEVTKDADLNTRQAAAVALARVSPGEINISAAVLLDLMRADADLLGDSKGQASFSARDDLAHLGPRVVPFLIEALSDPTPTLRRNVAATLGKIGPNAKEAVVALAKALDDKEAVVRVAVAASLARLSPEHTKRAVDVLVKAAKDSGDSSSAVRGRYAAISALGDLGARARPAIPALSAIVVQGFGDPLERLAADALKKIESAPATSASADDPKKIPPKEGSFDSKDRFSLTATRIKDVLGAPDSEDGDFLDYRGRMNVNCSTIVLDRLELMITDRPQGLALAAKLFGSHLFTKAEGNAIIGLLKEKGGEKHIGRFNVRVRESIVINNALILEVSLASEKK